MSGPRPEIVLASAGAGKTWALSTRFLALLAHGIEPQSVLATTFTRKAAAEILQRVLGRLAQAVREERALVELNAALDGPRLDRAAAGALLLHLLSALHRWQVRTLDSVFVELAGHLSGELGLPPGWALADESQADELAGLAVSRLLLRASPDELSALLAELHGGDPARSVHEALLERLSVELRELHLSAPRSAWGAVEPPPAPSAAARAQAVAVVRAAVPQSTGKGTLNRHWANALVKLNAALGEAPDWKAVIDLTLVQNAQAEEPKFSRLPIEEPLLGALRTLLDAAAHDLLAQAAREGRALGALLEALETALAELRRERGLYDFDDLPRLLVSARGVLLDERGAFLRDARTEHLLLDEFQDTSPVQWEVLAPLADGIVHGGRGAFFCVGDVKQAIFSWRGGDSALLAGLPGRYPQARQVPLDRSWRSSRAVLDFVNRVFGALPGSGAIAAGELPAPPRWVTEFRAHAPARDPPPAGEVLVREVATGKIRAAVRARRLAAVTARRARTLLDEHPGWRIGILVRRNVRIAPLLNALQAEGLHATGEGGHPLTDSAAVTRLLSALQLADHPGDRAAALHVASCPLGAALGLRGDGRQGASAAGRRLRAELQRHGYGDCLRRWRQTLFAEAPADPWDALRTAQLVELGHEADAGAAPRPSAFVARVRARGVEVPAGAAVIVTTVHRAKGLEYDAVLLPELDHRLLKASAKHLVVRDGDGAVRAIMPWVNQLMAERAPVLAQAWEAARATMLAGELAGLYVALTRAIHHLELLVPDVREKNTAAALLCELLDAGAPQAEGVLWRDVSPGVLKPSAPAPAAAARDDGAASDTVARGATRSAPTIALRRGGPARCLPRRAASLPAGARPSLAELLGAGAAGAEAVGARAARTRGTVIHGWFEQVGWLEDGLPDETSLLATGRRQVLQAGLDEALLPRWLDEWRAMLQLPAIAALLSRAAQTGPPGAAPELRREDGFARIVPEDGRDVLVQGRIDRLVCWRQGGRVTAAQLIDFKTDGGPPAALDERARHHAPQMQAYREALAARWSLPPSAVRATLAFVHHGELREV